ncbi:MAG TPA: hypothetical protein PL163_24595 [Leptospiraceae bacterium]|nr:hypothetical protein [Leptospiraceae bacterium]
MFLKKYGFKAIAFLSKGLYTMLFTYSPYACGCRWGFLDKPTGGFANFETAKGFALAKLYEDGCRFGRWLGDSETA